MVKNMNLLYGHCQLTLQETLGEINQPRNDLISTPFIL
jgi:hypothetical protein